MADTEAENKVKSAVEACVTAQAMIDINSEHLDGLRTQCATSVELTQHEIRALEVSLHSPVSRFRASCGASSLYMCVGRSARLYDFPIPLGGKTKETPSCLRACH